MEERKIVSYRDVWKIKNCRQLILSNLVNRFGDSIDAIAFVWLVYQITGSAAWSAIIFGLNQLPGVFILPLAGAWVEGRNKKKIIISTDIIRGLIVAAFALMYIFNMVNPYLMAAFTLIITIIESVNEPAAGAFVTELVDDNMFAAVHGLKSTVTQVVNLVGMVIAGVIIARLGIWVAMFIDVATFFIGALIMITIAYDGCSFERSTVAQQSYMTKLIDGFKYIKLNKTIIYFCFLAVLLNLVLAPLDSLITPLVSSVYNKDADFLSAILAMQFVGTIIASLIIPKVAAIYSFDKMVGFLGTIEGVACVLLSMGNYVKDSMLKSYVLAGGSMFVIGFTMALLAGLLSINLVKIVEQDYMARINGTFNAVATSSLPLGTFFVTIATLYFKASTILAITGIIGIIIFIAIWVITTSKKTSEETYAAQSI